MFRRQFWIDAAERAARAFAWGALSVQGISEFFNAFHADWGDALGVGLGSAAFSLLGSLAVAGLKLGNAGTASTTHAVMPAPLDPDPRV